jgi:hypothetical protein
MGRSMAISDEIVINNIYSIRGKKVMLDMDLGELYGVETKQLKRAVKRNADRFPRDFMFELNDQEFENLRSQFGTSRWKRYAGSFQIFNEHHNPESIEDGKEHCDIR